jgi:Mg-chelatase subunit ChlD
VIWERLRGVAQPSLFLAGVACLVVAVAGSAVSFGGVTVVEAPWWLRLLLATVGAGLIVLSLDEKEPSRDEDSKPPSDSKQPPSILKRLWQLVRRPRAVLAGVLAILVVALLVAGLPGAQTCGTATELRVLTSSDKEDAIRRAADGYMRDSADVGDCRAVNVNVTAARTSGEAIKALRSDWSTPALSEVGPRPDVWLPASSVEIEQARLGHDDGALLRIHGEGSVASTPLVLASSGAPGGPLRSSEPDRLRAQLRERRTVRTNPASSTAGLLATHMLYEAAPDIEARREWERDIPIGGDDPRALLCQLRLTDQRRFREQSAFLVPANVLDDFNKGRPLGGLCAGTRRRPQQELNRIELDAGDSYEAASTDEATPPKFDHPCVRVSPRDPASNEEERQGASTSFCRHLRSEEGQSVLRELGFADPSRGTPVDPDKLLREREKARLLARVLLAVDVSTSMKEPLPPTGKARRIDAAGGALEFVDSRGDELGLWIFATRSRRLEQLQPATRGQRDQIRDDLQGLEPSGATHLYDTVAEGVRELRAGWREDRVNALVILTDGEDRGSDLTKEELRNYLAEEKGKPVRVFIIASLGGRCSPLLGIVPASRGGCFEAATRDKLEDTFRTVFASVGRREDQ